MLEANLDKYEKRMIKKGKIEGRIEGKIEGRIEGKIEDALKMKEKGFDSDMIAEITGLTRKEIEKLK